jgi:hypothetical protein
VEPRIPFSSGFSLRAGGKRVIVRQTDHGVVLGGQLFGDQETRTLVGTLHAMLADIQRSGAFRLAHIAGGVVLMAHRQEMQGGIGLGFDAALDGGGDPADRLHVGIGFARSLVGAPGTRYTLDANVGPGVVPDLPCPKP